jgi:hypothetical protein
MNGGSVLLNFLHQLHISAHIAFVCWATITLLAHAVSAYRVSPLSRRQGNGIPTRCFDRIQGKGSEPTPGGSDTYHDMKTHLGAGRSFSVVSTGG